MAGCSRAFLICFIPVSFATIAFGLSFLANIYCETITFPNVESDGIPSDVRLGPWYYQKTEVTTLEPNNRLVIRDVCTQYPSSTKIDSKWKATRAFSIIGPVIGGVTVFWNWLAPCLYRGEGWWKASGMVFLFCCLCQGLTLLFLESNACKDNSVLDNLEGTVGSQFASECDMTMGSRSNIASVALWFVAGVLMVCVMKPLPRPERGPAETQTVTYTKTEQPDGTHVVTEEVVKGTYVEEPTVDKSEAVDTV